MPMTHRNVPDTPAPMMPPPFCSCGQVVLDGRRREDDRYREATVRSSNGPARKRSRRRAAACPLQHVSHRVVDRCDMVRIECVAQPEHVGDEAQPDQRRIV